MEDEVDGTCGP